jgi:hypothetical protein
VDAARAGAAAEVKPLVDELCRLSPEFKAMWSENDVRGHHGEAVKHLRHPTLGPIAFEYSAFSVDGRTDLTMVIHNPATPEDAERIKALIPRSVEADATPPAAPPRPTPGRPSRQPARTGELELATPRSR